MTSKLEVPTTVFDCTNAYKYCCTPQYFSSFQNSLIKYTLPGLGMAAPRSERLSSHELDKANQFMQKLSISKLKGFLNAQAKVFEKLDINLNSQRQYRWRLNKFLKWLEEQGWIEIRPKAVGEYKPYRFSGERHEKINRKKLTNRGKIEKFALSFEPGDYPSPKEATIALCKIQAELQEFEKFLKEGCGFKPTTRKLRMIDAQRFLGWLYRAEGVSLEELSLSSLVGVSQLNLSIMDFDDHSKFVYAQLLAEENSKEIAEECVKKIERFFNWLSNPPLPHTKEKYLESVVTIAKFLYRNQADSTYVDNYKNIPVISRLRILLANCTKEIKTKPPAVPYEKKAVTWQMALMVLERLRCEAIMARSDKKNAQCRSGYRKIKRSELAIANSFMRFLLVSMFVLVPPDRQQTYRELRLGETLKHGIYKENFFTPKNKMSNPDSAEYYIHLLPEDYKTGKFYGEWIGKLPNTQFKDGTTFYQYLDLWLYGARNNNPLKEKLELKDNKPLREALNPKGHNYVFLGRNKGMPLNENTLDSLIKHIFERMASVPVCPHTLRNMFRTYIDEIGISDQESKSVAFWMKHDLRTAHQYSRQQCRSKLKPGEELTKKINNQILKNLAQFKLPLLLTSEYLEA